jgi:hypothetical protein
MQMTPEEAIKILDPETSRGTLWKYEDKEERLEAVNEACRLAVAALRAQQKLNVPLTLEELRGMDWEPAWVEGAELGRNGREGYAILWYSEVEKYLCVWWPCEKYADIPRLELYGETWWAYRRRTEEGIE